MFGGDKIPGDEWLVRKGVTPRENPSSRLVITTGEVAGHPGSTIDLDF